jgi:diguanylate cyclase (GGDEF)-like protein/PAS domain S-box-containing protein
MALLFKTTVRFCEIQALCCGGEERLIHLSEVRWLQTRKQQKNQMLYAALAVFSLVTMLCSLAINRRLITIYAASVEQNQIWVEHLGQYTRLAEAATAVSAPGNNLFETHDVPAEKARFQRALSTFEQRLRLARTRAPQSFPRINQYLDSIEQRMEEMRVEAEQLFASYAAKDLARAGSKMAAMDRKRVQIEQIFSDLRAYARAMQKEHFTAQIAMAERYGTAEYLLVLMALLFATSTVLYGRYMTRAIQTYEQEQKEYRALLQQNEERFRALVQNTSDIIAILDGEGRIQYISTAIEHVLGYVPESLQNQPIFTWIHPEDVARAKHALQNILGETKCHAEEWRMRHQDQSWRQFDVSLQNRMNVTGIQGILLTCHDISERKVLEDQMQYQASHDPLTDLPNRMLFTNCLQQAIHRNRSLLAVLLLDLDNFKVINDSMGHEAGDALLIKVAERLKRCTRQHDIVARLGGDEFCILLPFLPEEQAAIRVAQRMGEALRQPVALQGRTVFISVSIGIVCSTKTSDSPGDLLRDADTAMYHAKSRGKAGFALFGPDMNQKAAERMEVEVGLRAALKQNELTLVYQPFFELATGRMSGVEALLRWNHPTRGMISPARFIPIAEETGLVIPIGYWVMEEACRQAQEWQQRYPDYGAFLINVNFSGKQLQEPDAIEKVRAVLQKTGIDPARLKLEITESVMMQDVSDIVAKLGQLKALGVKLAMDDFGTGYSSMANLGSYPLDTIKIDRSFVQHMNENEQVRSIVEAIMMLSQALHVDITAEGVETAEQLALLQQLGCQTGQGYYFAKPLPPEQIAERLKPGASPLFPMPDYPDKVQSDLLRRAA